MADKKTKGTGSIRIAVAAVTASLMWLSGTNVNRAIIVTDSHSVLRKVKNDHMWHEWHPSIDSPLLQDLVWIYCHTGVRGYKRGEWLDSVGAIVGPITMNKGDILEDCIRTCAGGRYLNR